MHLSRREDGFYTVELGEVSSRLAPYKFLDSLRFDQAGGSYEDAREEGATIPRFRRRSHCGGIRRHARVDCDRLLNGDSSRWYEHQQHVPIGVGSVEFR